jgi:hypothetical protein
MKFRNDRAYTNPEAAARKLVEIANSISRQRTAASSSS